MVVLVMIMIMAAGRKDGNSWICSVQRGVGGYLFVVLRGIMLSRSAGIGMQA